MASSSQVSGLGRLSHLNTLVIPDWTGQDRKAKTTFTIEAQQAKIEATFPYDAQGGEKNITLIFKQSVCQSSNIGLTGTYKEENSQEENPLLKEKNGIFSNIKWVGVGDDRLSLTLNSSSHQIVHWALTREES